MGGGRGLEQTHLNRRGLFHLEGVHLIWSRRGFSYGAGTFEQEGDYFIWRGCILKSNWRLKHINQEGRSKVHLI